MYKSYIATMFISRDCKRLIEGCESYTNAAKESNGTIIDVSYADFTYDDFPGRWLKVYFTFTNENDRSKFVTLTETSQVLEDLRDSYQHTMYTSESNINQLNNYVTRGLHK